MSADSSQSKSIDKSVVSHLQVKIICNDMEQNASNKISSLNIAHSDIVLIYSVYLGIKTKSA